MWCPVTARAPPSCRATLFQPLEARGAAPLLWARAPRFCIGGSGGFRGRGGGGLRTGRRRPAVLRRGPSTRRLRPPAVRSANPFVRARTLACHAASRSGGSPRCFPRARSASSSAMSARSSASVVRGILTHRRILQRLGAAGPCGVSRQRGSAPAGTATTRTTLDKLPDMGVPGQCPGASRVILCAVRA